VIALVLYPYLEYGVPKDISAQPVLYIFILLKEVFVGFVIGFVASVVFYAIQAAGSLLDIQRGASTGVILDPHMGTQVSFMAQFKYQLAIVVFLTINGHHLFLDGLFRSFEVIPLTGFPTMESGLSPFLKLVIRLTASLFIVAIQLVAPALITIFLVDIALGIMNRVAPQIQVFFLSMTIKPLIGILMIFLVLQLIVSQMERFLLDIVGYVKDAVELLK
jgi:flagellar biosynthetic protein FliR